MTKLPAVLLGLAVSAALLAESRLRAAADTGLANITMLRNDRIDPVFEATVQATEEAIAYALPHDRLRRALRRYHRLERP